MVTPLEYIKSIPDPNAIKEIPTPLLFPVMLCPWQSRVMLLAVMFNAFPAPGQDKSALSVELSVTFCQQVEIAACIVTVGSFILSSGVV